MIIKLTKAERDTILAALRRWQSYPAAREADSIATGGGRDRPLDNAEIERICKRMTKKVERKRDAAPLPRQSNNGALGESVLKREMIESE
jgi:hypothetical protein